MNTENYSVTATRIVAGDLVCVRDASKLTGIGYWMLYRRLQREAVPTFRLRGRRYVSVTELQNPALRIP